MSVKYAWWCERCGRGGRLTFGDNVTPHDGQQRVLDAHARSGPMLAKPCRGRSYDIRIVSADDAVSLSKAVGTKVKR